MKKNFPRVLITGGSGLLALNWAATIRKQNTVFLALHSRKLIMNGVNAFFIRLDSVSSLVDFLTKNKIDILISTLGLTNIELCEINPAAAEYTNMHLAGVAASACRQSGVRFVQISTDHLFAGDKTFVNEEELVSPLNVYGKTKAAAEALILNINIKSLIIRTNFFGWGPSYRHSISDTILMALRSGQKITLYKDVYYTPIIISELVKLVHQLLEGDATGIYNVVGDDRLSKYEFGLLISKTFNEDSGLIHEGSIQDNANLVTRPLDMSLSNAKLTQFIGHSIGTVQNFIEMLYVEEKNDVISELRKL